MGLEAVERAKLGAEVAQERCRPERMAGDAPGELGGRKAATIDVDIVAQPAEQRGELAALHLLIHIGNRDNDGVPQLCRVQVAERVGREVADRSHRPVDVLQAAPRGVGYVEAEVALDSVVPRTWKVGHRQIAANHRPLQIETQHDVQVVGRLVALDADQVRPHDIHRAIEVLVGDPVHHGAEDPARHGPGPLPERTRASDLVLPQTGLTLVPAEAERLGCRLAQALRLGQPLLVQTVPGLVHRRSERIETSVVTVAGRDPGVARPEPSREGMRRDVEATIREVEADLRQHRLVERALPGQRDHDPLERGIELVRGRRDCRDQRPEFLA